MIDNFTNKQLEELIKELEGKYQKLMKLANKLANEMDSLHEQYTEAIVELNKRKGIAS